MWHCVWRSVDTNAFLRSVQASTRTAAVKLAKQNPPVTKGKLVVIDPKGKESAVK